ncbi:flagellar hook protein FlgE [Salinihabitans flavidus]|uniref:Flagellar hook protein FlgE n=1 Tax=Salinihabitans flavidus TaxID=569882 RepID=A0A1H8LRZ4_9RHOB|nr:flagellar hook-basal body complex protein [Salinihabitans flavidus]SEO07907.1 flagellar hook protein FlgE [Salinihabitans flavidus]
MTISSSLNAGVAGLSANATRLAAISDNIANSSTFGYKRVESDFHSMVISSRGGVSYSAGGVRASNQRLIDQRGPLVSTGNATDLTVRGRGMMPVSVVSDVKAGKANPQMLLSTTGSFRTDSEGYLTTSSGLVLMGWASNPDGTTPTMPRDTSDGLVPVQINSNQLVGEPTTRVNLGVNVPATATEAGSAGQPESLSVEYFDNLGRSESLNVEFVPTVPAAGTANEWTMIIRDSASNDAVVGEYIVGFNDGRTDGGTLASVTATTGGAYDPDSGSVVVNTDDGPLEVKIGHIGDNDGLTQLSNGFAPLQITKNGSPVGNMTGVEVDASGFVHAYFDSGITRTIYQVPLADIPNPNGMVSLDHQTYIPSLESGPFYLWDAGDGPTGDMVAFAREESATDVAGELTDMIQTQRAYSSNAKVIQTVDEMLQETTNIKR